jgi:hypothetical protein
VRIDRLSPRILHGEETKSIRLTPKLSADTARGGDALGLETKTGMGGQSEMETGTWVLTILNNAQFEGSISTPITEKCIV